MAYSQSGEHQTAMRLPWEQSSALCARRLVAAFRTWLSSRGAGGPVPITEKTTLLPEHELLNHYEQHVRHCPSCSSVSLPAFRLHVAVLRWQVVRAPLGGFCA